MPMKEFEVAPQCGRLGARSALFELNSDSELAAGPVHLLLVILLPS